jgi:regulator of replication initiation timing
MFGGFVFLSYLCGMNQITMSILTQRELFLIALFTVTYVTLFVVAVQNSRRKILLLEERLHKVNALKESLEAQSSQSIEENRRKIVELEDLLARLGDENSMLRLELEEKKARLDYNNKVAVIDKEKRSQAETTIFSSDIYRRMQRCLDEGRMMTQDDWQQLVQLIDGIYTGFTEKLFGLYKLSQQDYYVSLLIKARMQPKEIAMLTAHSKESVASTRSRLYQKVFGKKGSSRQWDDFILSL